MAAHRVRLSPSISRYQDLSMAGVRLRVVATAAENMDREIFAYQMVALRPGDPNDPGTAAFSHVCSPVDLEEMPIGRPLPGRVPLWFRLDRVDILVPSLAKAHEYLEAIRGVAENLGLALDRLETLDAMPPFWCGVPPPPDHAAAFGAGEPPAAVGLGQVLTS